MDAQSAEMSHLARTSEQPPESHQRSHSEGANGGRRPETEQTTAVGGLSKLRVKLSEHGKGLSWSENAATQPSVASGAARHPTRSYTRRDIRLRTCSAFCSCLV